MEIDKSLNAYFSDAFYCINCSYFYETYMYCTFHYFLLKIFEYHQALGLVPIPELEQRALTLRKQQSLDHVQVYLLCIVYPCHCVYQVLLAQLPTDSILWLQ